MMRMIRLHQYTIDEDKGFRWFAHLKWRLDPDGNRETSLLDVGIEAHPSTYGLAAEVTVNDGEDDVKTRLSVPPIGSLYTRWSFNRLGLGWNSINPLRWLFIMGKPSHAGGEGLRYGPLGSAEREFGIEVTRGKLHVKIGMDDHGSTRHPRLPLWDRVRLNMRPFGVHGTTDERRDPRVVRYEAFAAAVHERMRAVPYRKRFRPEHGWEIVIPIDPRDRLLGARTLLGQETFKVDEPAVVPMFEGNYPCKVTTQKSIHGRPRWPWSREVFYRAEVEMDVPIPFPGKGENSYDIDDDACYSVSLPARSVGEAVMGVGQSVMRDREAYGSGQRWTPDAGWPEGLFERGA